MWLRWDFCLRISPKAAIKFQLRQDPSPAHSVVVGSSSRAVGLRASVLSWLLATGFPQFLDIWACPKRQFSSSKPARESLLVRTKSQPFVTYHKSAISSWLPYFMNYRQVTRSSPHTGVVDHTKCEYSVVGIIGVHFRNLPITTAWNLHSLPKFKICFAEKFFSDGCLHHLG